MDQPNTNSGAEAPEAPVPSPRRGRARRWLPLVLLGAILITGVAWGASAAYEASRPSLLPGLSLVVAVAISIAIGFVLLVLGTLAGAAHRPTVRRWLIRAAAAAVAGTVAGVIAGPAVGYRYRSPEYLSAAGTFDLELAGLEADFVPHLGAVGSCTTRENSQTIGALSAPDVGTLKGARVMASLYLAFEESGGTITVDVGGDVFPEGTLTPTWEGQATIDAGAEGHTGTAAFDIRLVQGSTSVTPGGWPDRLTGTLTWSCEG